MIEIICDNCERAFEVPDDQAGGKVPCPMCGDINRVPEPATAPAQQRPPEPAPRAADRLPTDAEIEQEICVVRPAMFRAHPFRFLCILILVIGGLVLAIAAPANDSIPDWLGWPGIVIGLFGLGWWIRWWIVAHLWIKLSISNKRTVRHEGIIRRHSTEVLHDHVRSVDIKQKFAQRLLNVGYIGIDSAGQDGIEIEVRDIPGPYEVKKIIDRYRTM